MTPTLYLSNWSSSRSVGLHGPGRKLTIMAKPRAWEHGEGRVPLLTPSGTVLPLLQAALADRTDAAAMAAYRSAFEAVLGGAERLLRPRRLLAHAGPGGMGGGLTSEVCDGDTLCCACSRAEAAAGRCHRAWVAPFLARAGWRVLLDGAEVSGV
jgi:hypothetical protein